MAGKKLPSPPAPTVTPSETLEHPRVRFMKTVKFAGLGLDSTNIHLDRSALSRASEDDVPVTEVSIDHSVGSLETDHFVVICTVDLNQAVKGSEFNILSIKASFSAKFDLSEPASTEMVDAFALLEARLVFFPYIRHFISDITYRMAVTPIVLPLSSEM